MHILSCISVSECVNLPYDSTTGCLPTILTLDMNCFFFISRYFANFARWVRTLPGGMLLVYSLNINLEHCFPHTAFELKLGHTARK